MPPTFLVASLFDKVFEIASPSPQPVAFNTDSAPKSYLLKLSNIFFKLSFAIPIPVSLTDSLMNYLSSAMS
jgi:hypothetical protein